MKNLFLGFIFMAIGIVLIDLPGTFYGQTLPGLGSAFIVMGAVLIGFFLTKHGYHQ
jgi:hypothetical protein